MNGLYLYSFFTGLIFDRTLWILYLTEYNFSSFSIGIFQMFLNLTMFFFEVPSGMISDKIGPKFTLLFSHIFIIIYLVLMLFRNNIFFITIAFVFYGIGLSLSSGADQSLIYQELESNNNQKLYQKIIGFYHSIGLFSMTIAIFLSGIIQKISWNWIYLLTVLFQLFSVFVLAIFKESKNNNDYIKGKEIKILKIVGELKRYLKIKDNKKYKYIILVIALIEGGLSVLYMYGQLLLKNIGLSNHFISMIFGMISICSILLLTKIYDISKKFSKEMIVQYSLYIFFICFVLMTTKNKNIIISTFIIIHIIYSIITNSLNTILHEQIPNNLRTTLVSVANFFVQMVMLLLFPVISFLNKDYSILYLTVIFGLITIVISIFLNYKIKKEEIV